MPFEPVFTVWDYYDGPRSGIANYLGQPHYYESEWIDDADNYAETFVVAPIDEDTLALALAQWKILREWEIAFHRGEVPESSHPGLAGNYTEYGEMETTLKKRISNLPGRRRVLAEFRARPERAGFPSGMMRNLDVKWKDFNLR